MTRPIGGPVIGVALAILGAVGLTSCGFVKFNVLSQGNPFSVGLPERAPPPPLTVEQIRGTACETGDWPAPDCLRYRSRTFDRFCRRPDTADWPECATLRTDLPLPPSSREWRPLLPPD